MRACAVPKCGKGAEGSYLMCKGHWFAVPAGLRAQVWRAWQSYTEDSTPVNFSKYRELRGKAVAAALESSKKKEVKHG